MDWYFTNNSNDLNYLIEGDYFNKVIFLVMTLPPAFNKIM